MIEILLKKFRFGQESLRLKICLCGSFMSGVFKNFYGYLLLSAVIDLLQF